MKVVLDRRAFEVRILDGEAVIQEGMSMAPAAKRNTAGKNTRLVIWLAEECKGSLTLKQTRWTIKFPETKTSQVTQGS